LTYENRLSANYTFGVLTSAAATPDTTLTSTDFSARLASGLSTTTYVPITLQDSSTGNFEIVWANAHTAAATTCTVLRGREGTSARAWASGTLWVVAPTLRDVMLSVANRAALPADAHVGMRCELQDEQAMVEKTLAGFQTMPLGIIGGRVITGTNNLGSAITTAETEPTSMDSGTVSLMPMRRYRIHCHYYTNGTVSNDIFLLRIREGASAGVGGNAIREHVHDTKSSALNLTDEFSADYETGASAVSKVFSLTAARVTGSGGLQFKGGGAALANPTGVWVEDNGPAGKLTSTAS
jgi:hypothetical protein